MPSRIHQIVKGFAEADALRQKAVLAKQERLDTLKKSIRQKFNALLEDVEEYLINYIPIINTEHVRLDLNGEMIRLDIGHGRIYFNYSRSLDNQLYAGRANDDTIERALDISDIKLLETAEQALISLLEESEPIGFDL